MKHKNYTIFIKKMYRTTSVTVKQFTKQNKVFVITRSPNKVATRLKKLDSRSLKADNLTLYCRVVGPAM